MIAFLDLQGCSLIIDIFRFLRSWWWMHPWWSNQFGATLQLKKLAKKVKSIWRCWNPGSTVWQESPQNKGGEFLNEKTCIHIFCGCLGRKFIWKILSIFFKHNEHTLFLAASPRYCLSSFATCNTAQVSILKRWWSSMHRAGESHHDPIGSDLTFEEELIIEREKWMWKFVKIFKIWIFGKGFRNDFLETSIQNMASIVVEGWDAFKGGPFWFVGLARNYKVPTVHWRCNKSCKITVATERRSWSPASQVSGPGGKLHVGVSENSGFSPPNHPF